jgi:hypothetical protein
MNILNRKWFFDSLLDFLTDKESLIDVIRLSKDIKIEKYKIKRTIEIKLFKKLLNTKK